jgi:hypothetical protein
MRRSFLTDGLRREVSWLIGSGPPLTTLSGCRRHAAEGQLPGEKQPHTRWRHNQPLAHIFAIAIAIAPEPNTFRRAPGDAQEWISNPDWHIPTCQLT